MIKLCTQIVGRLKIINFPFGTNGKLIVLGVPILKHITVYKFVLLPSPLMTRYKLMRIHCRLTGKRNGETGF